MNEKNILMGLFLLTTSHAMDSYRSLLTIENQTSDQLEFTIAACGEDKNGSFEGQAFPHVIPQLAKPQQKLYFQKRDLFSEYQRNCSLTNFEIIVFAADDIFHISKYIPIGSELKFEPTPDQNKYKLLISSYGTTTENFITAAK
ncbi:hypothetical protein [Candidatus Odyssella acanthamoebae]|uniref:Uncharacterized protein n=1 Tax=Candidatus Odyssella acanthamoebae TaxID=91604 RepID=A0A077B0D8_9PROT|nr:hypothetical protein [Candidatus Paracaedibacter acanthamoebae]AIK96405.1 hypothetical protein ID47_06130 [Candidatus Paracaedibacter acanthamoebae]